MRRDDIETDPVTDKREPSWSLTSFGLSLPTVAVVLVAYGGGLLWIDHRLAPVDSMPEQIKELRDSIYRQDLAQKDLQLRDERITALQQRVSVLECEVEGRKRCN
jgi:hypothetical protein